MLNKPNSPSFFTKRSSYDIIADILEFCWWNSQRQTKIMYKANLSWNDLKRYLNLLLKRGLLQANSPYYETTDKGKAFLYAFDTLKEILEWKT